jgi:ABC-2 type transport system permease protein
MIAKYFSHPGTLPWLFKYELFFAWRNLGSKSPRTHIAILLFAWLVVHLIAFAIFYGAASVLERGVAVPPKAIIYTGIGFWVFFTLLLSQTLSLAVNAFFARGDMDLLLTSPLNPKHILLVRGLGVGLAASLFPIVLLLPFAHVGLIAGQPKFLSIYLAVFSMALLAAAIGIWLTMLLVKLLGARRAKTAAQVLGAVIGASVFLSFQLQNIFPKSTREAMSTWFDSQMLTSGLLASDSVLWWPVRAFMGEAIPLLAFMAISLTLYWLVATLTYQRFVIGAQDSSGGGVLRQQQPLAANATVNYSRGVMGSMTVIMLKKEWRLILRDPQIITQTLLQLLYLLPLLFVGMRGSQSATLLIPSLVVLTAMLVGNLAWLTVAAEDAPDLIGSAPMTLNRMRVIKAVAAVTPPILLLIPLVIYWLGKNPLQALVLGLIAPLAAFGSASCYILNPQKANRREMAKRGKADWLSSLLEMVSAMGWGATAYCLIQAPFFLILAIPVALAAPLYSYSAGYAARRDGVLA